MGGSGAAPPPCPPSAVFGRVAVGRGTVRMVVIRASGAAAPPCLPTGLFEDGLELELAADGSVGLHDLESGHGVVVDVTIGVEAPLAVDALEVLGGGDRLAQGLALLGRVLALLDRGRGPLDRVDGDASRLRGVERVGGRLLAELL